MMFSLFPAASYRYVMVLAIISVARCCYSAILVDAFAPHLPQTLRITTKSWQSKHFFEIPSFTISSPCTPKKMVRGFDRIYTRMSQTNEEENEPLTTTNISTEGVPSSPLDRPVLSAIDAIALFVFAGVGKASHSADGSLDFIAVLVTAFPFLVSWFLIAPLVGSYTPEATRDVKSAVIQASKGWALAIPMGCVLRGVIKGYVPPLPFVVVTLIATLVILSLGRAGYTVLSELYVEMF